MHREGLKCYTDTVYGRFNLCEQEHLKDKLTFDSEYQKLISNTPNKHKMFSYCRRTVCDVSLTLNQHGINLSC